MCSSQPKVQQMSPFRLSTDNLDTPGARLKSIRMRLKLTRGRICKMYSLPVDTLRAWENGKLRLTDKGLNRCINVYRNEGIIVSKSWILTGEGLNPRFSYEISQYFSEIPNIDNHTVTDDNVLMIKEAEFFKKTSHDAIILLVTTDEMLPFYAAGDYVGGRLKKNEFAETALGKDCIIITRSGEKYFRRLSKDQTHGHFNLVCHNPIRGRTLEPVIYNVDIDLIAPVIWHRKPDNSEA